MHVSDDVSNCQAHMSRLKFYHLQVCDAFPDPATNSASAPSQTGPGLRSSQDKLHWIHAQEDSARSSWPPYISVKCQGLKTWVRLQQQEYRCWQQTHWISQLCCFTKQTEPYLQWAKCLSAIPPASARTLLFLEKLGFEGAILRSGLLVSDW